MNLPEHLSKVFDLRTSRYELALKRLDLSDPEDKEWADLLTLLLSEIKSHRTILARHNTWQSRYPEYSEEASPECVGCGWNIVGGSITTDINDCPDLKALAAPYANRVDFGTWP